MEMLYSDLWVNEGNPKGSPLLIKEEEALYPRYKALKEAINSGVELPALELTYIQMIQSPNSPNVLLQRLAQLLPI